MTAIEKCTAPVHCFGRDIHAVLFDLDGTLADTAPDLARALNTTLKAFGRTPLPFETIRPFVSHGGIVMISHAFDIPQDHPEMPQYRACFLEDYQNNIAAETTLFDGMEQVLKGLEANNIPWGVVTNKPAWLTDPLMEAMGLANRATCVISGDTTAHCKPHPLPIKHACRLAATEPNNCLYIGDAERDIEAGKNAGTATAIALFGYLSDQDRPQEWGADGMLNHPNDLLTLLSLE